MNIYLDSINLFMIKKLSAVFCILALTSFSLYSQELNLTDKETLISALNKKTFIVSDYGEIKFNFDNYMEDFLMLSFDVDYTLYRGKKHKTYRMHTQIPLTYGGFYQPDFFKEISLTLKESTKNLIADYPTRFQLLQNGEFYFLDKPDSYSFEDYYRRTIGNGETLYIKPKWILCKQK